MLVEPDRPAWIVLEARRLAWITPHSRVVCQTGMAPVRVIRMSGPRDRQ